MMDIVPADTASHIHCAVGYLRVAQKCEVMVHVPQRGGVVQVHGVSDGRTVCTICGTAVACCGTGSMVSGIFAC